uniref:Uncharacterized protein n=1 Tax=Lepeophtheirus salmonis TaxID=72036 RepID=A0A0K2U9G3_LEPSM
MRFCFYLCLHPRGLYLNLANTIFMHTTNVKNSCDLLHTHDETHI